MGKSKLAKNILVIDNFDSFVYVLVHYLGTLGAEPMVYRNNQLTSADLKSLSPDAVLISPGPGRPEDAGISNEVVEYFGSRCPVLGVCLGHQCIAQVYGAEIVRADQVCHGKTSQISHDGKGIFEGLDSPLEATRYHSLVVEPTSLPDSLQVSATTNGAGWAGKTGSETGTGSSDTTIMGLRHKEYATEGLQFHPESVLTAQGYGLLENFLNS